MNSSTFGDVVSTWDFVERRTLTWKIENFDEIRRSEDLILAQRIRFELGFQVGFPTEWNCYLTPWNVENVESETKGFGVFFSLTKAPAGAKGVVVSFQVRVKKCNVSFGPTVRNFMPNGQIVQEGSWGWLEFMKPDVRSQDILVNGCLLLELKLFSTLAKPTGMTALETKKRYNPIFGLKLHQEMAKLLTNPVKNSDSETKIISRDGVEFNVIRAILSARSPVFETMFQADMEESRTGIVRITDLSANTVAVLLHFFYTGKLHQEWKSALVLPELIYAAGKYQLADLLAFFDDVAGKVCSKENAGRLVGQARKLGLTKAEKELVEFIRKYLSTLDDIIAFAEECTTSNFA